MSSGENRSRMRIVKEDFVSGTVCSPELRHSLQSVDFIISLKELNGLSHRTKSKVDISMIRTNDFIDMLRQARDHRGVLVYKDAEIVIDSIWHKELRNYQTYASIRKIANIYMLNAFFSRCGFSFSLATADALLATCKVDGVGYGAFYVPPIVEYQKKEKILLPLRRLEARAVGEPILRLPGYNDNGNVPLQAIIDDWKRILDSSQEFVRILKDGTHRCETATLAGTPIRAITINSTASLMQSVPVRTDNLVITSKKPEERADRFLGVLRIGADKWEGWIDLARAAGIDG
ncbi:MAG: hypothetical protein ABSE71_00285 [Candidatus Micrarchaeaceae archaeon]|nr:hypothetical protein [Candidatus Micrarchaeota archaeon]HII09873.1 hypothetical protein [Candidatus Micrarchaeota archaeon]